MLGFSLQKLLVLATIVAAVWYGFRWVSRLQEARKLVPDDRDLINLRDRAYEIERTADLLYNTAKNAMDFTIAVRAEEESRASRRMAVSAHRLNILAAFFRSDNTTPQRIWMKRYFPYLFTRRDE